MLLSKLSSAVSASRRIPLVVNGNSVLRQTVRHGGHKKVLYTFVPRQNIKNFFKHMRIYTLIGGLPTVLVVFYTSYMMGEAKLYDYDMDQYDPEFYEFFSHPITRFLAKYCMEDPKLTYYKEIYAIELESAWMRLGRLCASVTEMEKRQGLRSFQVPMGGMNSEIGRGKIEEYIEEHGIETSETRP